MPVEISRLFATSRLRRGIAALAPSLLLLAAACGERDPIAPPRIERVQQVPGPAALLRSRGQADRGYQVSMTLYDVTPGRSRRLIASRARANASARAPGELLKEAGISPASGTALPWELMLTRAVRQPAGAMNAHGRWTVSRRLRSDSTVLVVREGEGRAPATTTSYYRNGTLFGRVSERWRPGNGEWELARREIEFVQSRMVAVAEFTHAPAALTLDAVRASNGLIGDRQPAFATGSGIGTPTYSCTGTAADCKELFEEAKEASDDVAWHTFQTLVTCGGAWLLAPTGVGAFVAGSTCALMFMKWVDLTQKDRRAWNRYYECLRRTGGTSGGMQQRGVLAPAGAVHTAGTMPGGPAFYCDGGAGGADEIKCYYYVEYDVETGEIYYVELLYCENAE